MGPVACIARLLEAQGPALGPALAGVSALVDQAAASSGNTDLEWACSVANAAVEQLDRPDAADGPHAAALLSLASRAFALLRSRGGRAPASPDALQYGLIRKLVGRGAHGAALAQGWELHAALVAARGPAGRGQQKQAQQAGQQQRQDALMAGAVINLVVCTAEAGVPDLSACGRLGAAVSGLAAVLREGGGGGSGGGLASQHADTLVRYLLKVPGRGGGANDGAGQCTMGFARWVHVLGVSSCSSSPCGYDSLSSTVAGIALHR
jgi:hypothetical protein